MKEYFVALNVVGSFFVGVDVIATSRKKCQYDK
jgi:hypothetical protein